jgi:tetratricopeptide (TPR) repeat protein
MKKVVFVLLFCLSVSYVVAGQNSYREQTYNAFVTGDIGKWLNVLKSMESDKISSNDKKLELISYYYGYIGYLIGEKNYTEAGKYITKGESLIAEVIKSSPKNATAYSFKGSYIGFRIALSKLKAITLGSESIANVDKALKIDPDNVQALVDKANTLYHAPKLFGGDKEQAVKYLQKAIRVMESTRNTHSNWMYLNTLVQLARMYENIGQINSAARIYEKILAFEPDYKLVKDELYPSLKSRMK